MSSGKKYYSLNGGVSLILLVFIILSLVSFATLSIVSARADERLTEKYMEQTTGYYTAYNAAQEYLAQLDASDEAIHATGESGTNAQEESAFNTEGEAISDAQEELVITKTFPINENQELVLTVQITSSADNEKPRCHVVSLVTNSTVVYEYDESLPVMKR